MSLLYFREDAAVNAPTKTILDAGRRKRCALDFLSRLRLMAVDFP